MKTKGFFERINQGSTSVWVAAIAVIIVWGLVALMVIAGAFLYLERPTLAQPPSNVTIATIAVQPTTAGPGDSLNISGQGWTPGSLVSIYLLPPGQTQISNFATAQATADGQGNFTAGITIPSGSEWQTPGTATVVARLAAGGTSAQTTFSLSAVPQAATATPTPTETATPVLTGTPTSTPTETATPATPSATAKVNLNVRSGPGINYPIIGVVLAGQSADIEGVSSDGGWWEIAFPAGPDGVGWVSAPYTTSQNTAGLPVVAAPAVPTPTPTATPVAQPPVAVISGPSQAGQNQSIIFDGNGSTVSAGHTIVDYAWNFGDGATANGSSVSHIYGNSGTFVVSLTVTDDLNQSNTATLTIQITAQGPTAEFDAPKEAVVGQSVGFDAGDSHAAFGHSIVDYDWSFNDGHSGSGSSPDHTFSKTGTFDVRLRVTDDQGLTSDVRHHITIEGLPTASISGPSQAIVGQSLSFSGSSNDDDITTFQWNFGDGSSASGKNVSHAYAQSGNFIVTLTVYDDEGASATASQVVAVTVSQQSQSPTAIISGPNSGTVNQAVNFDGSGSTAGSGTITGYAWDFGDGSAGSGAQVSHTYTKAGTYTVLLTVTNSDNLSTQTQHTITINQAATAPKAAISGPTSGTVNQAVSFDGSSSTAGSGTITGYAWDFGDGSNGSGATVNHTYTKAGKYAVILTVTNSNNLTGQAKHAINIAAPAKPKAAISGPTSGTVNQAVSFDGSSSTAGSGTITGYAWDFGDGGTGSGVTVNHTYTKAGKYAVLLTVTNSNNQTGQAKHAINIAAPAKPKAAISGPNSGTVNQAVSFSGSSSTAGSGTITGYAWNFGDGGNGSGATVSHTYTKAGKYAVVLTVTNSNSLTDQAKHTIKIAQPPKPPTAAISGPSTGKVNKSLTFKGNGSSAGSGKITKYAWSFGDGKTGSGSKVSHKYSKAGTYTVTLTVTNSDNLSNSTTLSVTIS